MAPSYLIRGFVVGFSIAAPVGPIGVLVIRRTLLRGRMVGLVSGLGAATGDAVYGAIAALGLSVVSRMLLAQEMWIRLVGGLLLLYIGVATLRAAPAERPAGGGSEGLAGAYASTFGLTLTNPATILSFLAVFAALGVPRGAAGAFVVAGVFAGSAFWWLLLSGAVGLVRRRFTPRELVWVSRLSGTLIVLFGLTSLGIVLSPVR